MIKITVPANADGSPRRHPDTGRIWPDVYWEADDKFPEGSGVVLPQPATGNVTLADGTTYDMGAEAFECLAEHVGPVVHHIERQYEARGDMTVLATGDPFAHVCTEACGAEAD